MEGSNHLIGLGKIMGNLHSFELALRVFLCEAHGQNLDFPKTLAGTVPESYLTNFLSLGPLIEAYNALLSPSENNFSVDGSIVKIRDAIAHGRLIAPSITFPLTLYKFGKPTAGMVPIERIDTISEKWLGDNRQLIFDQLEKISQCAKVRGYKSLS